MESLRDMLNDYLDEGAGSLAQTPQSWWKRIVNSGGGQLSDVVLIASDIFRKKAARGGETHFHKPGDKANQFDKAVEQGFTKYKKTDVAEIFIKIDDHPYGMVKNDHDYYGSKTKEKYSIALFHGFMATQSFRGQSRDKLSKEEFGETLPDGKCDLYFMLRDTDRAKKHESRHSAKVGGMHRDPDFDKKHPKDVYRPNVSLTRIEAAAAQKLGEKKIARVFIDAGAYLEERLREAALRVNQIMVNAKSGQAGDIDLSAFVKIEQAVGLITRLSSAIQRFAAQDSKMFRQDTWNANKRVKTTEYESLLAIIEEINELVGKDQK